MKLIPPALRAHKRALFLVISGVVATAGVGSLSHDALARWIRPARSSAHPTAPVTRVIPSPDGRWVAVELWTGVERMSSVRVVEVATGASRAVPFERTSCLPNAWSADALLRVRTETNTSVVLWIEPCTLESVRSTPDAHWIEQGLADSSRDGWSRRSRARDDDGQPCESIMWTNAGKELRFSASPSHELQTAREPGVVFETVVSKDASVVLRHDMTTGDKRAVVRVARWRHASVSPDGQQLLVLDTTGRARRSGHERAQVLDAHDGTLIDEVEAPRDCRWTGEGHRWIQTERDGHVFVHDRERDLVLDLGTGDARTRVEPLADGNLLVQNDNAVSVRAGATGALLRRL